MHFAEHKNSKTSKTSKKVKYCFGLLSVQSLIHWLPFKSIQRSQSLLFFRFKPCWFTPP